MDLYFEMYSGIAGDMTIAALLDLGANKEKLISAIDSLNLSGYELVFNRVKKSGIDAYNFDVILENHNHHNEEHNHCDEHKKSYTHDHSHFHRNIDDINKIIKSSNLNENVIENALSIFDILADAESKAHGIDKKDVHFHEVGAIDSIIDIVGVCVLLDDLNVENIYFSNLYEGIGMQKCAHGIMPVPVPAVANIISDFPLSLNIINENGEHITPTGAAIVKHFYKESISEFSIKKVGIGAGNRDFEKSANILRIMEINSSKKKTQ